MCNIKATNVYLICKNKAEEEEEEKSPTGASIMNRVVFIFSDN